MKRIGTFLLALMLALAVPAPCFAAVDEKTVEAPSAVLVSADTGAVLFEKNAHDRRSPASVTKLMTMLLVAEALDTGKIKLTDTVTGSANAASKGGSQIWLEVGEQMTVEELLKAVVIASANDACTALAEFVAGSDGAFVQCMNARAKELGLQDTHFVDASGLHDENHYTTLSDMAIIMQAALDNPHCREVLTSVNHTSPATAQNPEGVAMTNRFLYRIRPQQTGNVDIQAAKTGYTAQAMNCCVSYGIMENGRAAICVTAHAWTGDYCIADHLALYGTYCGT